VAELPRCDQAVFDKGRYVMVVHSLPNERIEEFVKEVARRSGQRVDWHYFGGRGIVKALGDISEVYNAIYVMLDEEENHDVARYAGVR